MCNELWAMIAAARAIVQHPYRHEWSVQGFGMLRTYLDDAHAYRLNIWHSALSTDASLIHDHPWSFRSWVIAGSLSNVLYKEHDAGLWYEWGLLVPGPDGGQMTPGSPVRMSATGGGNYRTGDTYLQDRMEIHETAFIDGTVTLNYRYGRTAQDLARVFWLAGTKWADAKPRPAQRHEIVMAQEAAFALFGK